jgi:4-alpha-glucanotransferase
LHCDEKTIWESAISARLREFIDWIAEIGFTLVQLLPINETGADNSPYNAISAMAIEPTTLHLAPGSPEDLTREDFEAVLAEVDLPRLRRGRANYRRVKELKQRIFEKGVCEFLRSRRRKATIRVQKILFRTIFMVTRLRALPRFHRGK